MQKTIFGSLAFAFAVATVGSVALAHSNGHESRTVADCEKLPGTQTAGERGACLACIRRAGKWHYHPDYPAGNRCRPDNGQP